jgi:hypothetical protein
VRDYRGGEAPAFEVALFPWVTLERTANSSILRPKGSRFDSPGQRPGTSPITTSSPKGAQPSPRLVKSGRPEVTARWASFFPHGTYTQAFSLGYRIATLWAANSRSDRTSLHVTQITAQLQKREPRPPDLRPPTCEPRDSNVLKSNTG